MLFHASPWRRLGTAAVSLLVAVAATLSLGSATAPASADNVVTPGSFTGYGFDQCLAPNQSAMNAWLRSSPFWAVGIYTSGDSRYCRSQPNLTRKWVSTQLKNGWRLLPITLGPQASCTTRERYLQQVRINPKPKKGYAKARKQGRAEANKAVDAAKALGITAGSTLWYDIEAFDISKTDCRESALSFLSAWTWKLHDLDYVSGVYSSAASGNKMLDDARANRPGKYLMPDQLWIADWNGKANVYSTYIRNDGWMPHKRVHQYRGGHNETHGGVTINIDSNWLDLGTGSKPRGTPTACDGTRINYLTYETLKEGSRGGQVEAVKCLLSTKGGYDGAVNATFGKAFGSVVSKFRADNGIKARPVVNQRTWAVLLAKGSKPLMKFGSASESVRRLQRTLNVLDSAKLPITGVFESRTTTAVKKYQADHKLSATGVVTTKMWDLLQKGTR